ncbi:MAG: DUF2318 domain-containing protein [Anaerolineae bacterium]
MAMSGSGQSRKSKKTSEDVRARKRAKFSEPAKQRSFPLTVIIAAGVAIVLGAGFLLWRGAGASGQAAGISNDVELVQPVVSTEDTESDSVQLEVAADPSEASADAAVADELADSAETAVQEEVVRLSVSTFDNGKAHFYSHQAGDTLIEYFVLKSSDGVIRAAFNACDVCFEARKGYRQEGDQMVCNNCGLAFPSTMINEVRGGCNPAPLERTVEGDELVISVDDILTGIGYFE